MVSPGPSVRMTKGRRRGKRKLHRPQDIREGVTNAYHIVKDVSRLFFSSIQTHFCFYLIQFNIFLNFHSIFIIFQEFIFQTFFCIFFS